MEDGAVRAVQRALAEASRVREETLAQEPFGKRAGRLTKRRVSIESCCSTRTGAPRRREDTLCRCSGGGDRRARGGPLAHKSLEHRAALAHAQ